MQLCALSMRLSWLGWGTGIQVFSSTSALELFLWLWVSWEPSSPPGQRGRGSLLSQAVPGFPRTTPALQVPLLLPS